MVGMLVNKVGQLSGLSQRVMVDRAWLLRQHHDTQAFCSRMLVKQDVSHSGFTFEIIISLFRIYAMFARLNFKCTKKTKIRWL
jgi:hypothetical protein